MRNLRHIMFTCKQRYLQILRSASVYLQVTEIRGRLNSIKHKCHINSLELQATIFCLKAFCKKKNQTTCVVQLDNATAVIHISKNCEPFQPHVSNQQKTFRTGPKSKIFGSPQLMNLDLKILLLVLGHVFLRQEGVVF